MNFIRTFKKPIIFSLIIIIAIVIISMPFVTQNHIYETIINSTDLKAHTGVVEMVASNELSLKRVIYPIELVFCGILGLINKAIPISANTLFLGFMVIVIICAGFVIYYVFKNINGLEKSWFILLIGMFCCTSILGLFEYGVIFNILNVCIVMMLAIWSAIKWLSGGKKFHFIMAVILSSVFCCMHPSGVYLPICAGILLSGMIVYKLMNRSFNLKAYYLLPTIVTGLGLITALIFYGFILKGIIGVSIGINSVAFSLFTEGLTWILVVLGGLAVFGMILYRENLQYSNEMKYLLWILGSMAIGMFVLTIFNFSFYSGRIYLDLATIVAMIIGILLVKVIQAEKQESVRPLSVISYILVTTGSISNLVTWVR